MHQIFPCINGTSGQSSKTCFQLAPFCVALIVLAASQMEVVSLLSIFGTDYGFLYIF